MTQWLHQQVLWVPYSLLLPICWLISLPKMRQRYERISKLEFSEITVDYFVD